MSHLPEECHRFFTVGEIDIKQQTCLGEYWSEETSGSVCNWEKGRVDRLIGKEVPVRPGVISLPSQVRPRWIFRPCAVNTRFDSSIHAVE